MNLSNTFRRATPGIGCFIVAICLVGCGRNGDEAKLIGRWRMEQSESLADRMFDDDNASRRTSSDRESGGLEIFVEFKKGGGLETRSTVLETVSTKRGTWELLRAADDSVEIRATLAQDEPYELTIEIIDADTIRMVPPNLAVLERAYRFHRKK